MSPTVSKNHNTTTLLLYNIIMYIHSSLRSALTKLRLSSLWSREEGG